MRNRFESLARDLNERITVQQVAETQNDYGEPEVTYSTYAMRWAKVVHKTGKEQFNGTQEVNHYTTVFIVRHDDITEAITEKMRVVHNGRNYDIEAVINPFEANREIRIYGHYRGD